MEGQIEAQRERKVVFEVYVADRAEFETQVAAASVWPGSLRGREPPNGC